MECQWVMPDDSNIAVKIWIKAVQVAQLVECWTPCGESTCPGYKSPGFEARRALDIYEPPGGYGCGWCQGAARRSREGDRPCAAMCVVRTLNVRL